MQSCLLSSLPPYSLGNAFTVAEWPGSRGLGNIFSSACAEGCLGGNIELLQLQSSQDAGVS